MPTPELQDRSTRTIEGLKQGTLSTAIGVAVRGFTWPTEYVYYRYSNPLNTASYLQIYRDAFRLSHLYQLKDNFLKAGVIQTMGKSASGVGVARFIEKYSPHSSAVEKGWLMAFTATPLEIALTSRGEYRKVQYFLNMQKGLSSSIQTSSMFSKDFARVMFGSAARVFIGNLVTFYSIYTAQEKASTFFPDVNPSLLKGLVTATAAFSIQPLLMPTLNFQTYVLTDPTRPMKQMVQSFLKENNTLQKMVRGGGGRAINRGLYYGLTFFLSEIAKEKNAAAPKSVAASRPTLFAPELSKASDDAAVNDYRMTMHAALR